MHASGATGETRRKRGSRAESSRAWGVCAHQPRRHSAVPQGPTRADAPVAQFTGEHTEGVVCGLERAAVCSPLLMLPLRSFLEPPEAVEALAAFSSCLRFRFS